MTIYILEMPTDNIYLQMKWYAAWDLLQSYLGDEGDSEDERKLPVC